MSTMLLDGLYVCRNICMTFNCMSHLVLWKCGIVTDETLGKQITNWTVSMGSGFIKISQIISSNESLLPEWLYRPLIELQDNVPKLYLFKNYGIPDILNEIDISIEPINCASISEVYKGTYKNEEVVIKILKPNIYSELIFAYKIIWGICYVIELFLSIKILSRIDKIMTTFLDQIDFRKEVENNKKFKSKVELETIRIPKIYDEFCTDDIIVMEYFKGYKITDVEKNSKKAEYITNILSGLLAQTAFVNGCIHCDLHPGNIIVLNEDPIRLGIIDFGLIFVLNDIQRNNLLNFLNLYSSRHNDMFKQITKTFCVPCEALDSSEFLEEGNKIMIKVLGHDLDIIFFVKSLTKLFDSFNIQYNDELVMFEMSFGAITGTLNQISNCTDIETLLHNIFKNLLTL